MLVERSPCNLAKTETGSASRPVIAALVVTHNRLSKLRVTLSRLLDESVDHVLVFNNCSEDGTAEWLATVSDPRLSVISNPENIGGAGGFSQGLRHLVEEFDPDWVVVMDDDGRPLPGSIDTFRNLPQGKWDAVGAAVMTPAGNVCEMNRPYRNPFWHLPEFMRTIFRGRQGFHLPDGAYNPKAEPVEIDMASFVGLFLSRAAISMAGYPDERMFIYGDDQIYTLTLRSKGGRLGFLPQIRFEHDTVSIQGDGRLVLRPIWKVYYNYRNALLAYRVAAGLWFWPLLPVLMLKWHFHGRHYGQDKGLYRLMLMQAIRDGLSRNLGRPHKEIISLAEAGNRDAARQE